jgi:hypothetical protein
MVKRKFTEVNNLLNEVIKNDTNFDKNNEFYYKIKKVEEFDSNFFDEASKAWNENKIKKNDCTYVYKCTFRNQKKVRCNRALYEYELMCNKKPLKLNCNFFCKMHINKKYNPEIHTFC